jgi:hypothetical protein
MAKRDRVTARMGKVRGRRAKATGRGIAKGKAMGKGKEINRLASKGIREGSQGVRGKVEARAKATGMAMERGRGMEIGMRRRPTTRSMMRRCAIR